EHALRLGETRRRTQEDGNLPRLSGLQLQHALQRGAGIKLNAGRPAEWPAAKRRRAFERAVDSEKLAPVTRVTGHGLTQGAEGDPLTELRIVMIERENGAALESRSHKMLRLFATHAECPLDIGGDGNASRLSIGVRNAKGREPDRVVAGHSEREPSGDAVALVIEGGAAGAVPNAVYRGVPERSGCRAPEIS